MANKNQKEANRKKGFNNFLEIVKKDWFRDEIARIRQKYDLPLMDGGLAMSFSKPSDIAESDKYDSKVYAKEIESICDKADLNPVEYAHIMTMYLMTGKTADLEEYFKENVRCCCVEDTKESLSCLDLTAEYEENAFPISLKISPYASQRDIITYIQDCYTDTIKPLQEKYQNQKNLTGRVRSKDVDTQKRNDFIYDHRELSLMEIVELTVKEYDLDQAEIAKIISYETKRRQEV